MTVDTELLVRGSTWQSDAAPVPATPRQPDTPDRIPPVDWETLAAHRGERNRVLERENSFLRAERRRLERLLATALRIASGDGRDCDPVALLDVCAAIADEQPLSTPAAVLEQETRHAA